MFKRWRESGQECRCVQGRRMSGSLFNGHRSTLVARRIMKLSEWSLRTRFRVRKIDEGRVKFPLTKSYLSKNKTKKNYYFFCLFDLGAPCWSCHCSLLAAADKRRSLLIVDRLTQFGFTLHIREWKWNLAPPLKSRRAILFLFTFFVLFQARRVCLPFLPTSFPEFIETGNFDLTSR